MYTPFSSRRHKLYTNVKCGLFFKPESCNHKWCLALIDSHKLNEGKTCIVYLIHQLIFIMHLIFQIFFFFFFLQFIQSDVNLMVVGSGAAANLTSESCCNPVVQASNRHYVSHRHRFSHNLEHKNIFCGNLEGQSQVTTVNSAKTSIFSCKSFSVICSF